MDYDDCVLIFEYIFKKINFIGEHETLEQKDIQRLLELINYKKDGKITIDEF